MNKTFNSEVIASTDLHAGGHLFGILFQKVLKFNDNGTVFLEKKVVDSFNPLDSNDITHLNSYRIKGKWQNSGKYIQCSFQDIFVEMKGIESPNKKGRLIFHCHDTRLKRQWGEVFESETTR